MGRFHWLKVNTQSVKSDGGGLMEIGQQEKLIFLRGMQRLPAPADDGCQLAMKTVTRSSEFLEDGNPDFFF